MSLMAMFCLMTASAQKTVASQQSNKVYDVVDEMPEFPGGQLECFKYLQENLKYPKDAEQKKVEGMVLVQFIIDEDGRIFDTTVKQKAFPSLDQEAIRIVKGMPQWKPGKIAGKKVKTRFTLPIQFRLQ